MVIKTIDAVQLKTVVLAAAKNLEANKDWINELNVFPVPDGGTGTNMTMTIMSAAEELVELEDVTMGSVAKAISSGSLRGARGNSGVILSQLFRGFTKEIESVDIIDVNILARALTRASDTARKAVMKPKEGTILTVAGEMAKKAVEIAPEEEDIVAFLEKLIEHGNDVLSRTPEMLPVLKQAGVVDSGGQGLMIVMRGAVDGLTGHGIDFDSEVVPVRKEVRRSEVPASALEDIDTADIKFGYCTEFMINVEGEFGDDDEEKLRSYLGSIGDSIVVVTDGAVVKVHVHTNHPGLAFEEGLTYGTLSRMKVDNMREQHHEILIENASDISRSEAGAAGRRASEPAKPCGFIAVSSGDGLADIFTGIGADYLIEGGQTMNPSTEDIMNAIREVNADVIYVLPNNGNIIMAAEQAARMTEDKKVYIVPSKTIPQGIAALITFLPEVSPEENLDIMTGEMERISSAEVTYAVRDTSIYGKDIHEGDIMGIGDNGLLAVGSNINETAFETVKNMISDDSELISVYYGADIDESGAKALADRLEAEFKNCEVELNEGGQPIYYYLLSVE